MRRAVLGLLALAGCNEIWGLSRGVDLQDGGIADADPDFPRIRLTIQIATTKDQGYMDPVLTYGPLAPPPAVQLGPIDGQLEPASYGADGTVAYPSALAGTTWRLAYTLADGVPHEVHWSPPAGDLVAHIVEPLLGRLERLPVPAGSGYAIAPVGSPTQHTLTRVFTTGLWTEGVFANPPAGATLNYDFGMRAKSLSGPLGAPERAQFDHGVLADFQNLSQNMSTCRVSSGAAAFVVPDLVAGALTPPEPPPQYFPADKQADLRLAGPSPIDARLKDALGGRAGATNVLRMEYGYVPSLEVLGFSKPAPDPVIDFFLPGPPMIAFANCTLPQGTATYQTLPFADPPLLRARFPQVVHVEVANQRTLGQLTLTSGFSAVVASSSYTFTSEFLVAAPTKISLQRGGNTLDLASGPDESTLPAGSGPLELSFDVEANTGLGADAFDVTLHAISNNKLDRQRVYTTTDRKLTIDPSFLLPGTRYVFEIRSYRGLPGASRSDFSVNTYPQYAATIFTRTFTTPP